MTFMREFMDLLNMDNWYNIQSQKRDSESVLMNEKRRNDFICDRSLKPCYDNSNHIIPDNLLQLYNGSLPKRKSEIISRDILSTVGVCSPPSVLCTKAIEYLDSNHSRIESCVYGAQICIPPVNNNELFLISHGYYYAGSSYRKDAIYWFKEYIKNGAVSDYIQSYILDEKIYSYDQRIKFVALSHSTLADLYTKEGMIDDANSEYITSINIAPFLSSNYIRISNNYIKQLRLQDAKDILQIAKKSLFYNNVNFKLAIDNHIIECNKEIGLINHYRNVVIPAILKIIFDNPGITQKDLYKFFPDLDTSHIRCTLKKLSNDNKIILTKKRNSYSIYPVK